MRNSTFQDIWKLPDQIRADLGTPLIQGLLDTISKLLAVRGRALLPQAAPVQQVPRLQVQGAGPRQQRPGRAAVGAHGSGRRRGPGVLRAAAGGEGGRGPAADTAPGAGEPGARLPAPPRAAGPRPACARARGGRRSGGAAERRPGKEGRTRRRCGSGCCGRRGRVGSRLRKRFLEDSD